MNENTDNTILSPINSKNHNHKETFKFDEEEIKQINDNDEFSDQRETVKSILNLINPSKKKAYDFKNNNMYKNIIHNKIEQLQNELNLISNPINNIINYNTLTIKINSRNNNKNFYNNIFYKSQKNNYKQKKINTFFNKFFDKNYTDFKKKNISKINSVANILKTESQIKTTNKTINKFINIKLRKYNSFEKSSSALFSKNTDFFLSVYKDSKIKNKYVRSLNKKVNKLIDNRKTILNDIKTDINKIINNNDNHLNNLRKKIFKPSSLIQKVKEQNKKFKTKEYEKYKPYETSFWLNKTKSMIKNKSLKTKKTELKFW